MPQVPAFCFHHTSRNIEGKSLSLLSRNCTFISFSRSRLLTSRLSRWTWSWMQNYSDWHNYEPILLFWMLNLQSFSLDFSRFTNHRKINSNGENGVRQRCVPAHHPQRLHQRPSVVSHEQHCRDRVQRRKERVDHRDPVTEKKSRLFISHFVNPPVE